MIFLCSILFSNCNNSQDVKTTDTANDADTVDIKNVLSSLPDSIKKGSDFNYYAKKNHNDSLKKAGNDPILSKLKKPSDFNSGWDIKYYELTSDDNETLSLWGISGNLSNKQAYIIKDYYMYKNVDTLRYGIGLRLYVYVKSSKKGADLSGLPKVAASVELAKSTASYRISGIGFNVPQDIAKQIFSNDDADFNVTNFAIVTKKFDAVASVLVDSTKGLTIDPQRIPNK